MATSMMLSWKVPNLARLVVNCASMLKSADAPKDMWDSSVKTVLLGFEERLPMPVAWLLVFRVNAMDTLLRVIVKLDDVCVNTIRKEFTVRDAREDTMGML
jgi:hypothetical protein